MFYCEECRKERQWPEALMKSWGSCELCGETYECHDRPSSSLPLPKAKKLRTVRAEPKVKRFKSRVRR